MKCKNCQEQIEPSNKFCPGCGLQINRTCSGCGFQLSGTTRFCPDCGTNSIGNTNSFRSPRSSFSGLPDDEFSMGYAGSFAEEQVSEQFPVFEAGETIGKYTIQGLLGEGKHAKVYTARHLDRQQEEAIKVVASFEEGKFFSQVQQEFDTCNQIDNYKHVLKIHPPEKESWNAVICVVLPMEKAQQNLRDWLEKERSEAERIEEGVQLFQQACLGVQSLHDTGIIHFDIKPTNLLLFQDDKNIRLKVADFGLARGLQQLDANRSFKGIGTPAYMSPEQVDPPRLESLSRAVDIYSLGVILYELLDGARPFDGPVEDLMRKHQQMKPPAIRCSYSEYLNELALQCLDKNPAKRPESAEAIWHIIQERGKSHTKTSPDLTKEQAEQKKSAQLTTCKEQITGMEFVWVEGGDFEMGNSFEDVDSLARENPPHQVSLDSFWIGKFPVTQDEWHKIMGENPAKYQGVGSLPVEWVSWDDAQEFIKRLKEKTGNSYRLPTEAEWEFAARERGKDIKWAGTNDEEILEQFAWCNKSKSSDEVKTSPVTARSANALGLHDMCGNVWEWCEDLYVEDFYASNNAGGHNPICTSSPYGHRVRRGGSWWDHQKKCRTTHRDCNPPHVRLNYSGLRIVMLAAV